MSKSRNEIDWEELKKEYAQGGTSYRKLAEKHDISFQILQKVLFVKNSSCREEVF